MKWWVRLVLLTVGLFLILGFSFTLFAFFTTKHGAELGYFILASTVAFGGLLIPFVLIPFTGFVLIYAAITNRFDFLYNFLNPTQK